MDNDDPFVSEMITQVARVQGVAINPDDPLVSAVLLNRAVLTHYLNLTVTPLKEAFAEAVKRARQDLAEHAREQATYVEQTMLRDREKFVTEQKAALQALDTSLRKRDAGIVKIMSDILQKARTDFAGEVTQAIDKTAAHRRKKEKNRAALGGLALGLVVGIMGTMATLIILLRLGIVGVVAAGQ